MRPSRLRVAAVQYPVNGGLQFQEFMDKMEDFVLSAARDGAELVVFPELFTADLFPPGDVQAEIAAIDYIVHESTPRFFESVQKLSTKLKIAILAGTIPRLADATHKKIRNTAFFSLPDGKTYFQDKIFLTTCESKDWGWEGGGVSLESPGHSPRVPLNLPLNLIDTPWGPIVISICYDTEIPLLSSLLASQLAENFPEIFLIPSCTGSSHGFYRVRWTAQARAVEHYAYVIHTGTVGPGTQTPNMNTQFGQAAIITPRDEGFAGLLAEGPLQKSAIVYADLDLDFLRSKRQKAQVYPARDQTRLIQKIIEKPTGGIIP